MSNTTAPSTGKYVSRFALAAGEPQISFSIPPGFEWQVWLCNRISQSLCSIANKLCVVSGELQGMKGLSCCRFPFTIGFLPNGHAILYIYIYIYILNLYILNRSWENHATCHENCIHWLHWFMAQMLLHVACCALYSHFDWLFASAKKAELQCRSFCQVPCHSAAF